MSPEKLVDDLNYCYETWVWVAMQLGYEPASENIDWLDTYKNMIEFQRRLKNE